MSSGWGQLAASLGGSLLQSRSIDKAADQQAAAAREAGAINLGMYNQNREDQGPYRTAGYEGLARLRLLLGLDQSKAGDADFGMLTKPFTGADLEKEPGYQFGLKQGTQATERSASARGGLFSGATLKALAKFGQDYGGTKFNEGFNRDATTKGNLFGMLSGVSGTGQAATNQVGAAGSNFAANQGNLLTGAANAGAAASLAKGNILQGGINQALYQWGRMQQPETVGG
jgi:hypothetical protein